MNRPSRLVLEGVSLAGTPPDAAAADSFSMIVAAGECIALLATEPAWASLLIDTLAGHSQTLAGRVLVDGRDVTGLPPARRGIGVVCERDPLLGHLTVSGNIAFALAARGVGAAQRGQRVRQTLALIGLDAQADRRPAELDPGDRVRAALARVLVCDPAALLLDDPLHALDPASRRALRQLLRRLTRARGLATLMVTRDREEALIVGERIGILSGPVLRQLGTAVELLDRPLDELVAVAFGEANSLSGRVEWVDDDVAHVRLSAGPSMDAMASGDLAEGSPCMLCIRPERIAVAFMASQGGADGDALGGEALTGTLVDMLHLGDHLQMRFRLAGGGEVLVRRPAGQPTAGLRADRQALLAWQAAHAVAFPLGG